MQLLMLFVVNVFAMHEQQMLTGDFLCAPVYYILGFSGTGVGGECLRDHNGKLGHGIQFILGYCTNNIAEVAAIVTGMTWCINNRVLNVTTESDSMMLIDSINKKITSHWQIKSIIEKI